MLRAQEEQERIWDELEESAIYKVKINPGLNYKTEPEMTMWSSYLSDPYLSEERLVVTLKMRENGTKYPKSDYMKALYKQFIDEEIEYLLVSRAWMDRVEETYHTETGGKILIAQDGGIRYEKEGTTYWGPFALDRLLEEKIGVDIVGIKMPYRLSEAIEKLYIPMKKKDKEQNKINPIIYGWKRKRV